MFLGHQFEPNELVLELAVNDDDVIVGRLILIAAGDKRLLLLYIFM